MRQHRLRGACSFFLALAFAFGATDAEALFIINEPWVRVAPDGRSAQAYMRLTSTEGATLISVRSFAADRVVIRAPGHNRSTVRQVVLPAGQRVELAPGEYRIQLVRLTRRVELGSRIPLSLTIRNDDGRMQVVPVDAEVRLRSPTEDESHPHHPAGHTH
jgi:copper(I)-binding protein